MAGFEDLYRMQQGRNNPLLNLQQMQVRMPNWLTPPTPQNSNLGSTGMLLGQMNRFGDVERQQQSLDIERQRAKDLSDIQLQTFQAEMARNKQAQEAREGLAGQEKWTPLQQAAIRAGYGEEVVKNEFSPEKSYAPIAVVGPDGNPILVPREQAVGMTPAPRSPLVQIGAGGKPPPARQGYSIQQDEAGQYSYEKVKGYIDPKDQQVLDTFDTVSESIGRVTEILDQYGPEPLPTGGRGKMVSAVKGLMLDVKELANLGVLSGPDVGIVNDIIGDPTEITAGVKGTQYYRDKLEEAGNYLRRKVPKRLRGRIVEETQGANIAPPPTGFVEDK